MELVLPVGQYVSSCVTIKHVASHPSGNELLAEMNFQVSLEVPIEVEVKEGGALSEAYLIKGVRADGLDQVTKVELHPNGTTLYIYGKYWKAGSHPPREMTMRVAMHWLEKVE